MYTAFILQISKFEGNMKKMIAITFILIFLVSCQKTSIPSSTITPTITSEKTKTPTITPTVLPTKTPMPPIIGKNNWDQIQIIGQIGQGDIINVFYSSNQTESIVVFRHGISQYSKNGNQWVLNKKIDYLEPIITSAFSTNGDLLAISINREPNNEIVIYSGVSLEEITTLRTFTSFISGIQFAPDNLSLYIKDAISIKCISVENWTIEKEIENYDYGMSLSSDGTHLLTYSQYSMNLFNLAQPSETPEIINSGDEISNTIFTPDGKKIVYIKNNGEFVFYNIENKLKEKVWQLHDCPNIYKKTSALFSSDGKSLIISCNEKLQAWNVELGTIIWESGNGGELVQNSSSGKIIDFINPESNSQQIFIIDEKSGKSTLSQSISNTIPWCFDQFNKAPFWEYLRLNWTDQITPPLTSGVFESWTNDNYYMDDKTISPNNDLVAYIQSAKNDNKEELIIRTKNVSADPLISYETKRATYGNNDEYAGLTAVAFSKNEELVSLGAHLHVLTWNLSTKELVSDISISDHIGTYNPRIYFLKDFVYTVDGLLIASGSDGQLHFLDTNNGTWLGSVMNPSGDGHYIAMNNQGSKIIMSTCSTNSYGNLSYSNEILLIFGVPIQQ